MENGTFKTYAESYGNTVCEMEVYTFSPAICFEFYKQHSTDNAEGRHSSLGQFRIDFTQIGRYECEFMDHTFSFRGGNEVTLVATPNDENWCLASSMSVGVYRGCALLIRLDKLAVTDLDLFGRFGINIHRIVQELGRSPRWSKLTSNYLVELFHEIYDAHALSNESFILLKALEAMLFVSQNLSGGLVDRVDRDFFPSNQVKTVKHIHDLTSRQHTKNHSFEKLAEEHKIHYPTFNRIFKEMYGDSPYQYLKKLKMNLAAQKMLETELSITEIAASVGYANPGKFSNAFASVMGVLPHAYRKKR